VTLEPERGCGYRKPGGLYLVNDGPGVPCDRLPVPIAPCACCGFEPNQIRSHQWLPGRFLGDHVLQAFRTGDETRNEDPYDRFPIGWRACSDHKSRRWSEQAGGFVTGRDPICVPSDEPRLLMWVGKKHYTPSTFADEARRLGISKRVPVIPEGLVLGETWVVLAHPDACHDGLTWGLRWLFGDGEVLTSPGVFQAFVPTRAEIVLRESEATPARLELEGKRGVDVVIIPDGAADARLSWRPGEPRPADAGPTAGERADVAADSGHPSRGPAVETPIGSGGPRPTGEGWDE
jgi:hypothetical protein